MVVLIASAFIPILLTSLSIRTGKVAYFSVFSPKQENRPSSSSASFLMMK